MKLRDFALILLLAFFWSFTFLLVRIGVQTVLPIPFTFYRLLYAFLFMAVVSICTCSKLFKYRKYFWKLVISSLFLNAIPFTLCAIGEIKIDSSTTGLIEGSTPFFVVLFGWLFFKQGKFSYRQVRAFLMGFLGLLVIFFPFIQGGSLYEFGGLAALLGMALSFAFGFNYSAKNIKEVPPIVATTIQLLVAPLMLLPFVIWQERTIVPALPHMTTLLIFILGAFTALGWTTYFYAIRKTNVINVSIATMITPLFTLIWGWLFLSEELTWNKILGGIVVIGALSILWNFHGKAIDHFHKDRKPPK